MIRFIILLIITFAFYIWIGKTPSVGKTITMKQRVILYVQTFGIIISAILTLVSILFIGGNYGL